MKTLYQWFIAAASIGCLLVSTAPAAVDMFLDLGEIEGEATDEFHDGEIDIEGFAWGLSNSGRPARGKGGSAGKANFQDISFFKFADAASPPLFLACATGQRFEDATFTVRYEAESPAAAPPRAEDEFLVITLEDVLVSSVAHQASTQGEEGTLVESITLNFAKITIDYTPLGLDGQPGETITVSYNVKKNRVDPEDEE